VLSDAMNGQDREQIAKELSRLTGASINASKLNDYTCTTKETARFPAFLVAPFCEVTGDDRPLRMLFTSDVRDLVKLGECEREMGRQQRAKATLVRELLANAKDRGL
jgi:hypothetical protein